MLSITEKILKRPFADNDIYYGLVLIVDDGTNKDTSHPIAYFQDETQLNYYRIDFSQGLEIVYDSHQFKTSSLWAKVYRNKAKFEKAKNVNASNTAERKLIQLMDFHDKKQRAQNS